MNNRHNTHKGAIALLLVVLFSGVSLIAITGGLGSVSGMTARARAMFDSKQTLFFADSVIDDAVYRVRSGKQLSDGEVITLGDLSAGISRSDAEGISTISVFATSTDYLARNMSVAVSSLAPPTFTDAVVVGVGGILMNSNSIIIGDAHANGSIEGFSHTEITGDASAVGTISTPMPEVGGTKEEGVEEKILPIIDALYWKAEANSNEDPLLGGLTVNGGQSVSYGPKKIEGDVVLNSNSELTVTGPLHITGSLTLNSGSLIIMDESLGSDGTVIIVDGPIVFNSNTPVQPTSADPKGYPVLVSLVSSGTAITLNSNVAVEGLLYAPYAAVVVNSRASAVAVVTVQLTLNSNAEIDFDGAIAERSYQGGGTGALSISGWKEIQ
ncbi:MAG: hypothetical protein Q8P93_04850 [bacterium]|nr:hypothetical protein [bacterium]